MKTKLPLMTPSQLTAEQDREIGEQLFKKLQTTVNRMQRQHGITRDKAADFLVLGALFTAAGIYERSLEETVEVAAVLVKSALSDELPRATRH